MEIKGGNIISQIKRLSDRIFQRILAEQKIDAFNGAQGRLLYVLWQEENISLRELSDRTTCRRLDGDAFPFFRAGQYVSLQGPVEGGLVSRAQDPQDRRKTLLMLTEKARDLQKDYMAVSGRMTDIFYEGFTPEEIAQCESMLARIHQNLQQYEEDFPG